MDTCEAHIVRLKQSYKDKFSWDNVWKQCQTRYNANPTDLFVAAADNARQASTAESPPLEELTNLLEKHGLEDKENTKPSHTNASKRDNAKGGSKGRHPNKGESKRDKKLFKQPPPEDNCPICELPFPPLASGMVYKVCCGKSICAGCIFAIATRDQVNEPCPFCKVPSPNGDKAIRMMKQRAEIGDAHAIHSLGCLHSRGYCDSYGHNVVPQDHAKAVKLYHRAAELGDAASYCNIGTAYHNGKGVKRNEKKAMHYYELAAMGGVVTARYNLGVLEKRAGNMGRAVKHYTIAAGTGSTRSLEHITQMYKDWYAMRYDYAKALCEYQENLIQIKSPQRDEAAAFDNGYKYY